MARRKARGMGRGKGSSKKDRTSVYEGTIVGIHNLADDDGDLTTKALMEDGLLVTVEANGKDHEFKLSGPAFRLWSNVFASLEKGDLVND